MNARTKLLTCLTVLLAVAALNLAEAATYGDWTVSNDWTISPDWCIGGVCPLLEYNIEFAATVGGATSSWMQDETSHSQQWLELQVTDIAGMIADIFEGLFFTEVASIFGLILVALLVIAAIAVRYEMGALTMPLIMYLTFLYFARLDAMPFFIWHIIFLICLVMFNMLHFAYRIKEGRG